MSDPKPEGERGWPGVPTVPLEPTPGRAHPRREPIGPIPEGEDADAYDRRRRRVLRSMPSGLYVLGVEGQDPHDGHRRRNLMTLNWATQVCIDPKLVAVAVEVSALTHQLLSSGEHFALSFLARSQRELVRRFVKPLEDDGQASSLAGTPLRPGLTPAPILACAPAWLECAKRHVLSMGSHSLFVGEVVSCGEAERPEPPELLRMEDTRMSYGG